MFHSKHRLQHCIDKKYKSFMAVAIGDLSIQVTIADKIDDVASFVLGYDLIIMYA